MISASKIDALFGLKNVTEDLLKVFMNQYWNLLPTDEIHIYTMSPINPPGVALYPTDCVRVSVIRKQAIFMFRHSLAKDFLLNIDNISPNNVAGSLTGCPICKL
jgi:hypothetical protein